MNIISNVKTKEGCSTCKLRSHNFFCNLSESSLQALESMKISNVYRKGTMLFFEGQPSNGIYMLCEGRVKLSTCSKDGKVIILRIAEAGEILGLSATVSDSSYETTAEIIESCQVSFIRKGDFMRFLKQNPEASLSVAKQLCLICHGAYDQIRSLALSNSVADKLAKLLVGWCKTNGNNGTFHLKMCYTHEEIAEMIGTSRETVSRLLKEFRERNLITLKGSNLIIHDKRKLEASIGSRSRSRSIL